MTHLTRLLALLGLLLAAVLPGRALADSDTSTVAVLYFDNQGNPELEPLRVGLAQMLITDLQGTEGVTVVERAKLQAILDELELGHSGKVDEDSAAKIGKLLGAEYLVMGSYFEMMGTLRIDTRLVKVETGEILHAHGVNATAAEFMSLEKQLAAELQTQLASTSPKGTPDAGEVQDGTRGATGPSDAVTPAEVVEGGDAVVAPDPEALEAAVAFSEGLIYLDKKDVARARESFQQAVDADPNLEAAQTELAALEI